MGYKDETASKKIPTLRDEAFKQLLDKIASLNVDNKEKTTTEIREQYQYGTSLSIKDDSLYYKLFSLAQDVLSKTKIIIEE